jgi:hypothetical protein
MGVCACARAACRVQREIASRHRSQHCVHLTAGGHGQELPAAYGIGDLSQMVAYVGNAPFTGECTVPSLHRRPDGM